MSSLDDILNRVLNQAVDSAATKVQGAVIGRRPLKDPESGSGAVGYSNAGVFSDLQSAIRTIHDPAIAQGLRNSASRADAMDDGNGGADFFDGMGQESPSLPAVRKTTLADDLGVIGTITDAGTSIVKDMAIAGKATQGLAESAGKLDRAVIDLTRSVVKATPKTSENQNPGIVGGVLNRASGFLESNSIAESVRAMVGRLRNGSDGPAGVGGVNGGDGSDDGFAENRLESRLSSAFDRMLGRAMLYFRSMSMANAGSRSVSDADGDGLADADENSPSQQQGQSAGQSWIRQMVRQKIGRAGRRLLTRAFRNRVQRGMRMARGGAGGAGGAGGTGGGWAGRVAGIGQAGGMAGGGIHHGAGGAAGGMGGGAGGAGGGAAAGGGAGLGLAAAVVGVIAFVAVIYMAIKALYNLGMQGYQTALRVAQFDGQLAAAKAQLDVNRLMRDIQTARDLSKSGADFMKALNRLEDTLRPLTDGALKIGLEFLTWVTNSLVEAFQFLLKATAGVVKAFDELEKAVGIDLIGADLIKRLEDAANGGNNNQVMLPPAGFHDAFMNLPPFAPPPRNNIPPLGGAGGGRP